MSDFRLHQIAPFLEKDAKTIRRWCETGVVPPLKEGGKVGCYRSPGGHWRISGRTREEVVEFLRGRIPKTSRRRKENAYPPISLDSLSQFITPRASWAKLPPEDWRWLEVGKSKRIHATRWGVIGNRSSQSEKHRFLEAVVVGLLEHSQKLHEDLQGEESKILLESLLKTLGQHIEHISPESLIPPNFEPLTASRLASECGVSRRTFYRWFPGWRRAVQKLVPKLRKRFLDETGGIVAGDEEIDFDGIDARNGWRDSDATP
jgi:hypothetical protein